MDKGIHFHHDIVCSQQVLAIPTGRVLTLATNPCLAMSS